jgi:hypothetical protein
MGKHLRSLVVGRNALLTALGAAQVTTIAAGPWGVEFRFPVDVKTRPRNELNSREHWAARHRRSRAQRDLAGFATVHALVEHARHMVDHVAERVHVSITWEAGPRCKRMDDDGLAASLKHVQDGVADALGIDDGDMDRISWTRLQTRGATSVAVRVEVPHAVSIKSTGATCESLAT